MSGANLLSSDVQYNPSLPVLVEVLKFMSSSTTSGRIFSIVVVSSEGEAMVSTVSKCRGSNIFSALRIPALSSTTSILPDFVAMNQM